jgi:hypothetical protein
MMRTILALALLTAAACGSVADPVTGCTTETVCARTCDTDPGDIEAWCAVRCGACEPTDEVAYPGLSFDGSACRLSTAPVTEARPSTCWRERRPWR